ncbi:MAG TPA: dihydroorotase [bacterium]|nr:dihydroorotase [bacterium]
MTNTPYFAQGIDIDHLKPPEGCRPGIDCQHWIIRGARVLDPASGLDAITDVFIDKAGIVAVGEAPAHFASDNIMEAHGLWLIPGLIDSWARLREPGQEHKATIASEARAATAAGITSVCIPPDTDPVIDTPAVVRLIKRRAQLAGGARILSIGALTQDLDGKRLAEIADLQEAGCVAVSNLLKPMANLAVMRSAMEYANTFDILVIVQPQDRALAHGGCAHEGAVASRLGLPGIPVAAETAAMAQILALVEETGARVHFANLSTGRAAQMLEQARLAGLPVSGGVSAHQLFLSEMDTDAFDANCHVIPPLRSLRDRDALLDAVARGVIEIIHSDHQPHEGDAKAAPFPDAAPGISALETLLPLTLRLVENGTLSLQQALHRVTSGPAQLLRLKAGEIAPGLRADLCLYDPQAAWTLDEQQMLSRGKNTPFAGWDFSGKITHTWVAGRLVFSRKSCY